MTCAINSHLKLEIILYSFFGGNEIDLDVTGLFKAASCLYQNRDKQKYQLGQCKLSQ